LFADGSGQWSQPGTAAASENQPTALPTFAWDGVVVGEVIRRQGLCEGFHDNHGFPSLLSHGSRPDNCHPGYRSAVLNAVESLPIRSFVVDWREADKVSFLFAICVHLSKGNCLPAF
jgi:hypothetical protein